MLIGNKHCVIFTIPIRRGQPLLSGHLGRCPLNRGFAVSDYSEVSNPGQILNVRFFIQNISLFLIGPNSKANFSYQVTLTILGSFVIAMLSS